MLALAGCNLPQRLKGNGSSGSGTGQPFVGTPPSDPSSSVDSSSADTLASKKGVTAGRGTLAGTVLDPARRGVPKAQIKVAEVEPAKDAPAPLTVTTDRSGYFDVSGLDSGRWYRLTARVRDGNRFLTGSARVQASNVRVLIVLTGEEPAGEGDRSTSEEKTEKEKTPASSAASLGVPIPSRVAPPESNTAPVPDDEGFAPAPVPVPTPRTAPPVPSPEGHSPDLIAKEKAKQKGWESAPANIPNPGQTKPPQSRYSPPPPPPGAGDGGLKPSSAPSASGPPAPEKTAAREESGSPARPVVPSCVRVGQRIENFTLHDFDGKVWDLKEKREGKLVLLDFWYGSCPPCRRAMPYLNKLDRYYRKFGLQVVGIANEKGTLAEKQDRVRPIREEYRLSYPTLFSGGGAADCPVLKQFEIQSYPTLVLLDQNGRIVWRGNGLDEWAEYNLEMSIRRHLGIR
jgi:thiol-disulfide isomerase/thioredoxin